MQAERLNAYKAAPAAMRAVQQVEAYIQQCGLEKSLIELVKMRASQINGCAYCLDTHSKDARRQGETEQRLYLLNAWHESLLYTERERAALGWTEALHPRSGDACARRSLRRSASALRGKGARRPYDPDRSDQFVEPAGDRLPLSASGGTSAVTGVDAPIADAKHRFHVAPEGSGSCPLLRRNVRREGSVFGSVRFGPTATRTASQSSGLAAPLPSRLR